MIVRKLGAEEAELTLLHLMMMIVRKLGAQEARERASADQLTSTDEKTKEYEKLVILYKYVLITLPSAMITQHLLNYIYT